MYLKKNVVKKEKLLCFTKWSRKAYAVFNTLHKEVKIGVLSLSAVSILGFQNVNAQSTEVYLNEKVDLDELVVSADVTPELQSEIARVVTVVTKEEIQASPVNSITDLLEFALNVDVRQRGNHGVQSDVSIRGGSFDQVMVLLNGVNITDPQTGHNIMNIPIDLSAVDRIEVLQGSGARHLGANAFSGAINIITNAKSENSLNATLSGGEFGFYNGSLSASYNSNAMRHFVSLGAKGSDGYIDNTDFNKKSIFYQGGLNLDLGSFEWQAGYVDNAFGANSFYTAKYPDQFEQVKTTFASAKFTSGKTFKVSPSVYYRGGNDRFELFRDGADIFPFNFHKSNVYGAKLNTTYYSDFGKSSFGAEVRNENSLSNTLGNTPDTVKVKGYDAYYFKSFQRTNYSFFAEHQFKTNRLFVTAGIMGFGSSAIGNDISFYPGLDVSYELFDGFRIKSSVNRSLRMPTFTDLFYNGPTNVGNPNLKPETSWSYEGGFKYYKNGISSHITAFYRKGSNLIDWVQLPDKEKYTTTNYTKLNTLGLEMATRIDFGKLLSKPTIIRRVQLSYAYIENDKVEQDFDSKYALDYLKHKFTANLNHAIAWNIYADWNVSWQDRAGNYQKFMASNVPYVATSYDPFWLVSTKVYWQKSNYKVFVEASNLFDTEYLDVADVNQPGRWFRAGVVLNLNY